MQGFNLPGEEGLFVLLSRSSAICFVWLTSILPLCHMISGYTQVNVLEKKQTQLAVLFTFHCYNTILHFIAIILIYTDSLFLLHENHYFILTND